MRNGSTTCLAREGGTRTPDRNFPSEGKKERPIAQPLLRFTKRLIDKPGKKPERNTREESNPMADQNNTAADNNTQTGERKAWPQRVVSHFEIERG